MLSIFQTLVIPEYTEKILSQSWLNILTSAVLLYIKGDKQSLQQAKEAIMLAKKFLQYADETKKSVFQETIEVYESKIRERLAVLNKEKSL